MNFHRLLVAFHRAFEAGFVQPCAIATNFKKIFCRQTSSERAALIVIRIGHLVFTA